MKLSRKSQLDIAFDARNDEEGKYHRPKEIVPHGYATPQDLRMGKQIAATAAAIKNDLIKN